MCLRFSVCDHGCREPRVFHRGSTWLILGEVWRSWTSVLGLILGTVSNFGVAFGVRFAEWFAENYWAILLCTLLLGTTGFNFKFVVRVRMLPKRSCVP